MAITHATLSFSASLLVTASPAPPPLLAASHPTNALAASPNPPAGGAALACVVSKSARARRQLGIGTSAPPCRRARRRRHRRTRPAVSRAGCCDSTPATEKECLQRASFRLRREGARVPLGKQALLRPNPQVRSLDRAVARRPARGRGRGKSPSAPLPTPLPTLARPVREE